MKSFTEIFKDSETQTCTCGNKNLEISLIDTSRKNRPNIRKPYEYICKKNEKKFVEAVKKLVPSSQYVVVYTKNKKYGYLLKIWALSCAKGFIERDVGTTEKEWNVAVEKIQHKLFKFLGQDAILYAEPFNKKAKFQLSFETYVYKQ